MATIPLWEEDRKILLGLHVRVSELMALFAWLEKELKTCLPCAVTEERLADLQESASRLSAQLVMGRIEEISKKYGLPGEGLLISPDFREFTTHEKS